MDTEELINLLPKVWLLRQCAECRMVFALPLGELSSIEAVETTLGQELERHVGKTHEPEFPSDWKAEHLSQ